MAAEIVSGASADKLTVDPSSKAARVTLYDAAGTELNIQSSASSITSISAATSSTQLLAANANRVGLIIYNESASPMYIKFGTTASATDFTYELLADTGIEDYCYTGRIDGIWIYAGGNGVKITELT